MASIEGSCTCGKVTYSGTAEPIFVGVCHCTTCQKVTGSAFNSVVAVPSDAIKVSGQTTQFDGKGDSGQATHRQFCPVCGSSVTLSADMMPGVTMVTVGTLDDPSSGTARDADFLRQRTALGGPSLDAGVSENAGTALTPASWRR